MRPERRLHRVFVTRQTEYHLRGSQCVGVRHRGSGRWLRRHLAVRGYVLYVPPVGEEDEWLGQRLHFVRSGQSVSTSPILAVARPALDSVVHYVSHTYVGVIEAASEPKAPPQVVEASGPEA